MATEHFFFDDMLGEYLGVPVQVGPSNQAGYAHCVFAGNSPDPERSSVLHLDLESRVGLFNAGMHWFIQANDSERFGHAWDDNEPDQPARPYPFEDWVRHYIGEIVAGIARRALRRVMKRVTGKRSKGRVVWHELEAALQLLYDYEIERIEQGLSRLGEGWECGYGLAFCHLRLGHAEHAAALFEQAGRELDQSALLDDGFRFILSQTLPEHEELWSLALMDPLDQLARQDRPSTSDELTDYLVSLSAPALVELWVTLLIEHVESADRLAALATRLVAPEVAGHSVRLLEQAIELAGETPTLLALLQGALYAAGDLAAAEALGAHMESEPSVDDIQGKIDEYTRLNNTVSAHQSSTGVVPLSFRDKVARALQLESELNAFWRRRPERYRAQDCRERRFVSGGSALWVSMLRDAKDYAPAVEQLRAVTDDWPLFLLRFEANPQTVEVLLNNGLGACLDSSQAGHLELGVAIMERCRAELPPPELALLHWAYACLYARQGHSDEAMEQIQQAVKRGVSTDGMLEDSDLATLRGDPRFMELVSR